MRGTRKETRTRGISYATRAITVAAIAAALLALMAVPALAEGYNAGDPIPVGDGWGPSTGDSRTASQGFYTRATGYLQGPHGGYDTTTNKCQDCHSTHYAYGSYMLLRANSREAACDFCHTGGGGSGINIQMDNDYNTTANVIAGQAAALPAGVDDSGYGTGHSLGYTGKAPADVDPAYEDTDGFACFDCHTPHGNSARVLTTFGAPGTAAGPGNLFWWVKLYWDFSVSSMSPSAWTLVTTTTPTNIDDIPLTYNTPDGIGGGSVYNLFIWGLDIERDNIVCKFDFSPFNGFGWPSPQFDDQPTPFGTGPETWKKPLFRTGKYLLIKNPDNENGLGLASDSATGTGTGNKILTDWENPLGPAATWGDFFYTSDNEKFPLAFPFSPNGIAMVNEFCTDCHDGAAGQSDQAASVWYPEQSGGTTGGSYITAYSHDSQPRGCARQQYLDPGDGKNFGPHCRNCHAGAASCEQCHGLYDQSDPLEESPHYYDYTDWGWGFTPRVYPSNPSEAAPHQEGHTIYDPPAYVRTSAYYNVAGQCIDGGFSYPHRTLGANLLKDAIYGVDFDGTLVAAGEARDAFATTTAVDAFFNPAADGLYWGDPADWSDSRGSWREHELVGAAAENLDSVCIDCHGDATYWNGDDPSYYASFSKDNPVYYFLLGQGYTPAQIAAMGIVDHWDVSGWELMLKGLP